MALHQRRRRQVPWPAAASVVALLVVGGCSGRGSSEEGAVGDAATAFFAAVTTAPEGACDLLAPATEDQITSDGKECAEVLAEAAPQSDLASTSPEIHVYGRDAMVQWADETLFLARFDGRGWLVTAADCQPTADDLPFDCTVEGR